MHYLRRAGTRSPVQLTTLFSRHPARFSLPPVSFAREYHQPGTPPLSHYSDKEALILDAAYQHVPTVGFHRDALVKGTHDAGYVPAAASLFSRGAFELVLYHLTTNRLQLNRTAREQGELLWNVDRGPLGAGSKVNALVKLRLKANEPVISKYQEALALMSLAENIPASLTELSQLADDLWYLAGDTSVDSSWYTKRGLLAAVYASSEIYMTQDTSEGFKDTEHFVDRRLEDVRKMGYGFQSTTEWLQFTGLSTVNVLRSFGAKV